MGQNRDPLLLRASYIIANRGCVYNEGDEALVWRMSVIKRSGGNALHPIDILFWACLMLGGVYTVFNLLMGGLTHAAGHVSHVGHALHIPHVPDLAGHVGGHAEVAHHA